MFHRALLAGIIAALPFTAFAETVTILHVNDIHSRIEPIDKYDSTCSTEDDAAGECFGGAARLASAIAAERLAADGPLLLLDAGDQFQGSLFFTQYLGKAAAEIMNTIGFDAMAVGNHEFDEGPRVLRAFIDAVDFPVVMANAEIEEGTELHGAVPSHTILEAGGQRYGVFGLLAPDTGVTSSPGPGVTFTDPIAAARAQVAALQAEGVDRIILLSHLGLPDDKRVAAAVEGIDLVVGGHSHTLLSNSAEDAAGPYPVMVAAPDGDTPIVQAGAYGKYLGKIDVTFDDDGNVTAAVGDPILLDASVPQDPAIAERVTELAVPLEAIRRDVVGQAAEPIDGSRESCRAGECAMGNLVADAMLDRVKEQGISIAIQNGGGLRASIDEGDITMGDVLTVLPFQNTLATFELTGAQIKAALENGVSGIEDGEGRFAQVAGMRYSADTSVAPGEGRITSVEIKEANGWEPIDVDAVYGVVSNNFMRGGGDGYEVFTEAQNAYDYGPGLEVVFAAYLEKLGEVTPALDGRITVK
ncbi:MAG: 5'-nucleotidase C-terminal domain-containing protein [Pseudomonadota bacterium]